MQRLAHEGPVVFLGRCAATHPKNDAGQLDVRSLRGDQAHRAIARGREFQRGAVGHDGAGEIPGNDAPKVAPDHGLGRVLDVARIQPAGELAQLPRGNTLVHLLADAGVRNERLRHGVHDPAGRNFF